MIITIPSKVLYYNSEQYKKWVNGERGDCPDGYCKGLPGSYGFGEYLVGCYYKNNGYSWIHHDFDVFGGNRPGKYPVAEDILIRYFGKEKYESARTLYKAFKNIEQPDLLIFKPDLSEVRFAEAKRQDTRDKLRESQIRGLVLISVLLGCKVEVFDIVETGKDYDTKDIVWEF
jgi:hypothetical protein